MYNEVYKQRFMAERNTEATLPKNYLKCQFEKISAMEERLEKDASNFTFYEIIEYYKLLHVSSVESLIVMNSQFSLYTQWCIQQNLVEDSQNHFFEIRNEDFVNCINKGLLDMKIISKETIYSWIEQLPNAKDQFILLALFEGIRGKKSCELVNLKPEDIKGNVAHLCTGRKVEISNKLLSIIDNCIQENTYYSITGKGKKVMPLVNRGYIIKDYPNTRDDTTEARSGRQIQNSVQRIMQYFDLFPIVSAADIVESGKINMIREQATENGMNCRDYIYSEHISDVEEKYDFTILKKSFILKYEDYLF